MVCPLHRQRNRYGATRNSVNIVHRALLVGLPHSVICPTCPNSHLFRHDSMKTIEPEKEKKKKTVPCEFVHERRKCRPE